MTATSNPYSIQQFREQISEIGTRIKTARQSRGMTQGELADLIGISSKSVSAIEVGRVEPSISQIQAISRVLEEPIGYFIGETHSTMESKIERVATELEEIRKLMQLTQLKKR